MAITIQFKRGRKETWEAKNPILAYGEPGFEPAYIDEYGAIVGGNIKIGDGTRRWNSLPYLVKPIISVSSEDEFLYPTEDFMIYEDAFYRAEDSGYLYMYYKGQYTKLSTQIDIDESNKIIISNDMPNIADGSNDKIYIVGEDLFIFDENKNNYILLNPKPEEWILEVQELPETGETDKLYKIQGTKHLYIWTGTVFEEVGPEQKPYIKIIETRPEIGEEDIIYKEKNTQTLWHWNTIDNKWEAVNANSKLITDVENLKKDLTESLENIQGINDKIDSVNTTISNFEEKISDTNSTIDEKIALVEQKINDQNSIIDGKIESQNTTISQQLNTQNETFESKQLELINTVDTKLAEIRTEFDELEEKTLNTTEGIYATDTVMSFPLIGEDRKLYKALDTQKIYYWDSNTSTYELLKAEAIELPEVKGGIEVIPETETLPSKGESDMLYKTLSDEKVYTWNESTTKFVEIGSGSTSGESIVVVETLEDLTNLKGESNILYRVLKNQKFYAWNATTEMFEPMASGGGTEEEGFKITFVSYNANPIFAITKSDRAILKYGYSSIDENGIKDGIGIGTLNINGMKKATIAINQSNDNEFDITDYLSLGENSVTLVVTNTQGKEKILSYSIEYADLAISCETYTMQIQREPIPLSFKIMGSGEKKIYIQVDDEEPVIDSLHATQQVYPYTIPMQKYGDHIVKIHLERIINGIQIKSNVLKLGIISVGDEMVDAAVLSIFEETESQQGEVITIPYQVYNPVQQTSDVILTIFDENGEEYFSYQRTVDRNLTYWTIQNFPAGNVTFQIKAKSNSGIDAIKNFPMTIAPSEFDLEIIKTNLELEFSAEGRSNDEKEPDVWSYGDYKATFENFAWSNSDGWIESEDGETVLRFLAGNKMTIPFQPFATDRINTGYTIELEFASRDVADYDAVLISCLDQRNTEDIEGIPKTEENTEEEVEKVEVKKMGFEVKSSMVTFNSTYRTSTIQYKEDERVRVTIIFEPKSLQSYLIYIFVNGVISDVIQYPDTDIFKQQVPANIEIGSDKSGLDLYKLRFYNRAFSFTEQLNNFICDRPTNAERTEAKRRNDIYDVAGNITENSLPPEIPYLVIESDKLPEIKEDKYTNRSCYFVDKLNPERSFTATGVQLSIQGTSSAGYPIKNFKVKFKEGIILPNGEHANGYPVLEGHLPSECLCLKADFASSEQANNVMLVEYYDKLIRTYFKTPPQEKDPRIRTGIAGRPIVVFWHNTDTDEVLFWGQYNMNNDKSNENVFGFDNSIEGQEKLECWEFSNNTSNRCLFIESEYENETWSASKNKFIPDWMSDFEARYPDLDEPYDNYTNLKRLTDWIVSTCQSTATDAAFDEPITFHELDKNKEEIYYDKDSAQYRLAKFKNEFDDYFFKEPVLFYYLFTETFLMIDSRAKNMFLTTFDGNKWFPIPYDFDTAIGINNEGALVFEYDLEDYDTIGSKKVFNGQDSTLWINVRDAFQADLFEMYKTLRSDTKNPFSYEAINDLMNKHQEECWPEAIWNADAKKKYIDVYLDGIGNYLDMCQGNKKTQREWWLYNAFKYRDSKYQTGDAQSTYVYYRAYAPGAMTITPYQHLWPRVDYTDSYPVSVRAKRNEPTVIPYPQDTANNSEFYIRSADRLSSFGDMSIYLPDHINFANATKLQEVILGSDREGYVNDMLVQDIFLGNNRLLKYLNIENCINFAHPLNISECVNLEILKAFGSKINTVKFPVGGHLKEIYLPATIQELKLQKQHMIEHFEIKSYANIQSLWIDDTPGLPIEKILLDSINSGSLNRIRLTNITWRVSNEETLRFIFNAIKEKDGIDVDNQPLTKQPIITGYLEIDSIQDSFLEEINDLFPELIIVVNGKTRFFLRYVDWDNTLIYKRAVSQGENAFDPIGSVINPDTGLPLETPTREGTEDTSYKFSQWSNLPTNLQGPQVIVAMYNVTYRIQFLDGDENILNTQWVIKGNDAYDPLETGEIGMPTKTSTAQYDYVFSGWDSMFTNIISPLRVYAVFNEQLRQYDIYFYNGNKFLEHHKVFYGNYPEYRGDADALKRIISIGKDEDGNIIYEESEYFAFTGWSPGLSDPVIGETIYRATFDRIGEITDDWSQIIANVQSGNIDEYGYAGIKKDTITYSYKGETITDEIEFEIIGKNHDLLVATGDSYNKGASTAGLTFKGTLSKNVNMNTKFITTGAANEGQGTLNNGGWMYSELRAWLNGLTMIDKSASPDNFTGVGFIDALPTVLKNGIKPVKKSSDGGHYSKTEINETQDKIFIPSLAELNITNEKLTYNLSKQGIPYVLYTDDESRRIPGLSYWTRSSSQVGSHAWNLINSPEDMENGVSEYKNGSGRSGIVFMFCI